MHIFPCTSTHLRIYTPTLPHIHQTARIHACTPLRAGYDESREALAKFYSLPTSTLSADDVIIASGCSGALDLAIGALYVYASLALR